MTKLNAEQLRQILSYDAETGVFTWNAPGRGRRPGPIGSADAYGYKTARLAWKSYKLHRLAWLYVHGVWPSGDIDHINGIRDDNRLCNLRDVPRKTNLENQRSATNNQSTGLLGAYFDKRKGTFYSRISMHNKSIHLGTF